MQQIQQIAQMPRIGQLKPEITTKVCQFDRKSRIRPLLFGMNPQPFEPFTNITGVAICDLDSVGQQAAAIGAFSQEQIGWYVPFVFHRAHEYIAGHPLLA